MTPADCQEDIFSLITTFAALFSFDQFRNENQTIITQMTFTNDYNKTYFRFSFSVEFNED